MDLTVVALGPLPSILDTQTWNHRRYCILLTTFSSYLQPKQHHINYYKCPFDQAILTPPQLSVLARSLPVPMGRMPTGGGGHRPSESIVDRIQPTVPSPPAARIRMLGTFLKRSNLGQMQTERLSQTLLNRSNLGQTHIGCHKHFWTGQTWALHWYQVNKHGCALRSSNLKQKST